MKWRIALWAGAGFVIAGLWAIYFFAVQPPPIPYSSPIMTLVEVTCPIVFLRSYPLSIYLVLFANATTYALFGLIIENLRKRLQHA
jgi:hypothetical protein